MIEGLILKSLKEKDNIREHGWFWISVGILLDALVLIEVMTYMGIW